MQRQSILGNALCITLIFTAQLRYMKPKRFLNLQCNSFPIAILFLLEFENMYTILTIQVTQKITKQSIAENHYCNIYIISSCCKA